MTVRPIEISRDYYERALAEFGDDPRGVNWRDRQSQELRFQILSEVGDLSGRRLHDVGCGLGHLQSWLRQRQPDVDYVGSDISEKMIAAAKARAHDNAVFYVADILNDRQQASWMRADYIINSGVFTVKSTVPEKQWRMFVHSMVRSMFGLAEKGIAFNLMTSFVDYRDDHLFYEDPGAILEFCVSELSRKVVIRHDYPLWEYVVYVYK